MKVVDYVFALVVCLIIIVVFSFFLSFYLVKFVILLVPDFWGIKLFNNSFC